jgi:hypothetical protein
MWTSPATVAVGQVATAAMWNQQVRDNMLALAPTGKVDYFMQAPTTVETLIQGAWLELNAVDVSRTTYPGLWTLCGTTLARTFTGAPTLTAAIDNVTVTVPINAWPAAWPTDGRKFLIQIDTEKMLVTAGYGTTSLTVTRAVEGTAAAAHANAAAISAPSQSPFGHGDGSTKFTLPEAGARSLIGATSGGHADAAIGHTEGTTKANRRQAHRHTVNDPGHGHSTNGSAFSAGSFTNALQNPGNVDQHVAFSGVAANSPTGVTVGASTSDALDQPAHIVMGVWAVKI